MNAISSTHPAASIASLASAPRTPDAKSGDQAELRKAFGSVVGETLFGQTLKSMRKSVHKSAYFHGGRGEEVFQQQLDQVLAKKITETSAEKFTGPMFDLFMLRRG
jgi:peptidoglycan hydrolase FlgJ